MEPDEQRMRKAAHLMVGSLAGSLALVTCRDPLRTSLTNRLRSLLAQGLDAAMLEQYVQVGAPASSEVMQASQSHCAVISMQLLWALIGPVTWLPHQSGCGILMLSLILPCSMLSKRVHGKPHRRMPAC